MTMFLPTGGGGKAIDADDVSMIVPRLVGGLVYATCWLAGGISIPVDALPAALAAEVNALAPGLPLLLGPLVVSNFSSPVYVGGAHVQRVDPTASGLGSVWRFANTTSALIAPATTVAQAIVLINATGGGGGNSEAPGGAWEPDLTPGVGTTALVVDDSPSFLRSGLAEPRTGDAVSTSVVLNVTIAAGAQMSLVVSNLPAPANEDSEAPILEVTRLSGDATAPYIFAEFTGDDEITITQPGAAVVLETNILVSMQMAYRVQVPA